MTAVERETAIGAGTIAAALLLPPLGVYRRHGPGRGFWVATGLTLLGFLPGVAFALIEVLRPGGKVGR